MKGYAKLITGEAIEKILDLPKDAHILKILTSDLGGYVFKVICYDPKGWIIPEGGDFPIERGEK